MAKPLEFATLLGMNPLFSGLGATSIQNIAALCQRREIPAGRVLFAKGDVGDAMYGVRRGLVRIEMATAGGERLIIDVLGPGDLFGEIALLDGHPRTADAVAAEACELFVLARDTFLGYLERDPKLAVKIIELLCRRIRSTNDRMEETIFLPLQARLARRLRTLAEDFGSEVHITQEELAGLMGVARESVNRQLNEWRESGIVKLSRGRIWVLDTQRLAGECYKA